MKNVDRKKILDALVGNIPVKHKEARKVLEDCCLQDLEAISPIVDEIVKREVQAALQGGANVVNERN
jgi:hypothetical protein